MQRSPWRRLVGLAYLAPALFFVLAFTVYPLLQMAWMSLHNWSLITPPSFVGLANYRRAFTDHQFWVSFLFTLEYTAIITPILMIGGYLLALLTVRNTPLRRFTRTVVFIPVVIGLGVSSLLWYWLFSTDFGLANRFLLDLGVIDEPLTLIRTTSGVIIGMSHILLPFMVLPMYAVMRRIDPEYGRAAANLGASPLSAFLRVFLPLSLPGVLAGSLLVFVLALGFYITPALLGGLRDQMISQLIVQQIQQRLDWGFGTAMSVLLVGITLAVLFAASRTVRLRDVFGSSVGED